MEEYRACSNKQHHVTGSGYPATEVPIENFRKIPGDLTSGILKTCIDCRNYKRRANRGYEERWQAKVQASHDADGEFMTCSNHGHNKLSKFDRESVPREQFLKYPNDPRSHMVKICKDCSGDKSVKLKFHRERHLAEVAEIPGVFVCSTCHVTKDEALRSTKKDGSPGASCKSCKEATFKNVIRVKGEEEELKLEFMLKQEASCYKCRCLYFHHPDDYMKIVKYETNIVDGIRHVVFKGYKIEANDLLRAGAQYLAYTIMEFDHLPEAEQRARGMLKPSDPYIPKRERVSNIHSKAGKRLEALKCQLLCSKCHVEETIAREDFEKPTGEIRRKQIYVDDLKEKGCVLCGYVNVDLLRFFHLDHLNPTNKIDKLANMTRGFKYTMQDVIDECAKCRVLCAHCHKLHTEIQRREGIL